MNIIKKTAVLCLPWLLVACSSIPVSSPVKEAENVTVQPSSMPDLAKPLVKPKVAPVDQAAQAPAVVSRLLERSQQQLVNGDEQSAEAFLERAIRIAPRYPESYLRLGELRYQQARYQQARSLGQKAISLGADGGIRREAVSLIERASAVN